MKVVDRGGIVRGSGGSEEVAKRDHERDLELSPAIRLVQIARLAILSVTGEIRMVYLSRECGTHLEEPSQECVVAGNVLRGPRFARAFDFTFCAIRDLLDDLWSNVERLRRSSMKDGLSLSRRRCQRGLRQRSTAADSQKRPRQS